MAANNTSAATKRTRPTSLGGLAIVLTSILLSTASYGRLTDTVRVRWTVGTYQHYGPEHAPTLFVLVAFPMFTAGLYLGARWLRNHLERSSKIEQFDEFRTIYDISVLLILGMVIAGQLVLILLNL